MPIFALEHLRVIDGTGGPVRSDQTIVVARGAIVSIGPAASAVIPADAQRLDLRGYFAMPGLVGMHDHLFYSGNFFTDEGVLAHDMPFSYPRLYLAAGVTTIRTTGSFEPYTDLEIRKSIDSGTSIGPHMNVTGPYLEGVPLPRIQIHKLGGPEDATRLIDYWAAEGVGSFKVYADITRAELRAAIAAAHRHRLSITGHLCSIGFEEAAEMGIDGLEHGLFVDTEFAVNKQPDICPQPGSATAADLEIDSEPIRKLIHTLVAHHVAVTSTLPVWEEFMPARRPFAQRVLRALSPEGRRAYEAKEALLVHQAQQKRGKEYEQIRRFKKMLPKEMQFEKAFVEAGGLLLAGPDGVLGGDIAGFGDQRELELLVRGGFSPSQAIQIASLNGARFLGQSEHIGSLEPGKNADIVIIRGDPSVNISDVEHVEIVFKDGIGYDSRKLFESVAGQVGHR